MRPFKRVILKDKNAVNFNKGAEQNVRQKEEAQEEHALKCNKNRAVMHKVKVNLSGVGSTAKHSALPLDGQQKYNLRRFINGMSRAEFCIAYLGRYYRTKRRQTKAKGKTGIHATDGRDKKRRGGRN